MRFQPKRIQPGSAGEHHTVAAALVLAALVLLLDQCSKVWMEKHFNLHESLPVIPDLLSLTLVYNKGAAWSILSGYGWLLLLIAGIVVFCVIRYFRYLAEGCAERFWALLLILSGVAGNSIDRLWRGAVVDFIDVHYKRIWNYPVFNVADIAICIGIFIFALSNLLRHSARQEEKKHEELEHCGNKDS